MSTEHLHARFYDHPKLNVEESTKAGHKVYDSVLMVELKVKGERGESVSKLVVDETNGVDETEYYKAAFPGAWAQYKGTGGGDFVSGTLLKALGLEIGKQTELEQLGIRTVEDLADMADSACMKMRDGLTTKGKAIKFLDAQKLSEQGNIVDMMQEMRNQLDDLKAENEALKNPQTFGCDECDREFETEKGLKRHQATHANAQAAV